MFQFLFPIRQNYTTKHVTLQRDGNRNEWRDLVAARREYRAYAQACLVLNSLQLSSI